MDRNYYADGTPIEDDHSKVWAVDFDGVICEDAWPGIGAPNETVIDYLKSLKAQGDRLILWTCREGENLEEALAFCAEHGLEFDAVNSNLPDKVREFGNDCRKVGADYYMDDRFVAIVPDDKNMTTLRTARLIRLLSGIPDVRRAFIASIESAIDDYYCGLQFADTTGLATAIFDRVFDAS